MKCSKAHPSSAGGVQGRIGLVTRERTDRWGIESTRFHGLNMVIWDKVTRPVRTPTVGAHLPNLMMEHLPDVEEALHQFKEWDLILRGDLNMELDNVPSLRRQCVTDLLT